uniref:Macaca fascicularis brain cDNA clone: QflA-23628, similar to human cyclin-dependent kinase 5 (CDK5), mRNA, RefSeq: NM_004935.2 n=1 Tax=Macaca fascicularis TaxID=9541 RepID=I7GP28_MACFA|nr:unnamed protein product [Macaca fascicularis]
MHSPVNPGVTRWLGERWRKPVLRSSRGRWELNATNQVRAGPPRLGI